jgi:hypothetical protein
MGTIQEYKTFTCSCGYKADVFGQKQKDFSGTFDTHVCLNCKILIDCCTAEISLHDFKYHNIEPRCLCCDKGDLILWNVDMCRCPKCENKMNLTRLELNIDNVGTIKII